MLLASSYCRVICGTERWNSLLKFYLPGLIRDVTWYREAFSESVWNTSVWTRVFECALGLWMSLTELFQPIFKDQTSDDALTEAFPNVIFFSLILLSSQMPPSCSDCSVHPHLPPWVWSSRMQLPFKEQIAMPAMAVQGEEEAPRQGADAGFSFRVPALWLH